MQSTSEQYLALAKRWREEAAWLNQQERIRSVRRSNDYLILSVRAARMRGGIDISDFDFDALNPDWQVIDDQVVRLKSLTERVQDFEKRENLANDEDDSFRVLQLIKQAIETPTPQGLVDFLSFTNKFKRLAVWNARMAYIQRPGARVIATEFEWRKVERTIAPDAVPIIILWPFAPIRFVYELEDTNPPTMHNDIRDPFAAIGDFRPEVLLKLTKGLSQQKNFKVRIVARRLGSGRAGTASIQGVLSMTAPFGEGANIGQFAGVNADTDSEPLKPGIPSFRIAVNDRLHPGESFATIAHELGHIFCGHLGPCNSGDGKNEESGWPDRRSLGLAEREVEAEAVAFLVASRAGLTTGSAAYLKTHAERAVMKKIDIDLIVRAAARIERIAKIHYGSMTFNA
jgi:hypothetical protein